MSALMNHAHHAAGNVGNQLQRTAGHVGNQLQTTGNRLLPPQQRKKMAKDAHTFANRNPKLAAFLAVQATLTGIPLLLFVAFAITTLLISFSTCLLLAVTTAFVYTFFAVGIALLFLIPTLFLASCAATSFFLWGLALYVVLRRLNKGEQPSKKGTRVGDKLHALTGGRLEHMAEGESAHGKEVGTTSETAHENGVSVGHGGGYASRLGGDGRVNGNGEWEAKWSEGTQRKQVEFAKKLDIKIETIPTTS